MSEFLTGGGEMGELIRNFDWSATPLGSPENWDQSLKTSVRICLDSRFPIVLWLGKDLRLIYNNAWRTALGSTKHPSALGSPAKIVWAEIWDTIGPMLESVMQTGEATWIDDGLLLLERFGYIEESYWTYSYSAIRLNSGEVGGVFAAVHETTATVIGERQLTSLKNFTNLAADEKTVDAIFRNAAAAFEKNNKDFPFAIIYKIEGITAKPIAWSGIDEGLVSPYEIDITEPLEETFNLCKAYETNQIIVSQNNGSKTNLPTGAWEVEPTHFIHIPITTAGQKHPHAILLAALNPYRKYDDSYRQFTTLVADQIALEVNSVLAYEEERKRAEALAEIDRTKTAFFTNISHEFRTPLTLILGSLEELLNNGKSEVNEDRETIETTHRNALRLLRLVNNLLDFNRIEAGKAKATFIDVTEEVLARKKIEESEQRFSSLVKDATVGIIVLQGEDLKVAVVNAAYGKLIGRTPEQLTGKELFHVIPEAEAMFRPILDKVRATGEPVYQYGQPYRVFAEGNKEEGYLNLVYQPYKNLDGEITGVMVLCQDVTEQVLSHRMAEESEERLSIALDGAELGTYDFFPQTGMLLWSRKTKELFGLPPDAEVTYDVYLKGLHPDDREKADMAAQTAVGPQNGGYYENEYRTIGITDGRLRWVRSKGKISFDEEGKPVRLTGIIQEITQQKELLANLQLQSLVLDRMDEGVSISNEEGLILFTNPAEDKMFGYEAGELIGKHVTIQNAYPPEENEIIVSGVIAELKEKGYWSGEWHNRKKDGTSFFTHSFITTLKADGKTVFVCVQRDVTQDKEVAGKLAYRKALLEAQNEAVPDAILVVDTKGKILSYNRHFATLWNIPQEIIDRKDDTGALQFAMTQVADPQRFIDRVNYCYSHPNTKDYEEVLFKDGRIIERCGNAIIGEDGIKYGWIWHFRDVTEQKRASEILRASEDRYQNFIRQSTEGIWRFEVESPISTALPVSEQIDLFFQHAFLAECNDAMAKMYGYEDAREMIGMRLSQFFPRDEASEAYLSHFITSRYRVEAAESKETDRHGATVYFMNNLIGIVEDGKLIRAWGTQRNITAQKEAEESLKESESLFRTLAETLPQMIWVRNTNGNIEYSSKNWETYSGIKDMREAWRQITHPHDWEPIMSVWQKAMQAGDPFKYEARLRNKEGEYRWHYAVGEPVKDESGTVIKYIGALTDIHAQKTFSEKLENEVAQRTHELRNKNKELENAQSFLQQLIDSSVEYVAVLDKGLRYITVNKKFEKALGLSRENIRGKSVLDISPKTKGYFQLDCIQKAFQGETVHLDKNASVSKPDVFIDTYYIPYVVGENIEGVIVMARDVTDIVKAEKLLERRNIDLAQAQSFLQTVLDLSVEMVAAFDTELNYTFLNKKVQEFLGKDSSDVIGKPITAIHPGIENSSTYQQIKRALAGEVVYTDQRESYTRKGHVFESYILPLKDGEQIVGVVTMQRDITQIVRLAENLKQTNQELQRSNEDLQQFAHVASHDLKEPVRKVITFGDRLKRECANELSEKANTYLSKIESSAARMYSMIDGVLLYSSLSAVEQTREVIDLNDLMHDITVDLEVPIAEKVATITYKHLPRVEGSSILIYQLLYNMINNSLKFSKEDVSPLIEVTSKIAEPDKLEKLGLTESAKYVTIIIKDNGIGFNNDAAEKIFGTFTRLHAKDKFEGTGLGLALCKKIAERHGGAVYAEGKEGEGATFYILLPQ